MPIITRLVVIGLWVDAIDPHPASDFTNKIGPWPPPAETVLMVSHLSGSCTTPDLLRCSCILRHCCLAPTVVTVAVVITSTLIAAIRVAVVFSLPRCPLVAFFRRLPVLSLAIETQQIRSVFFSRVSGCVLFNSLTPKSVLAGTKNSHLAFG